MSEYENRRPYKTPTEQIIGWLTFAGVALVGTTLWWVDYHTPGIVVWFANRVAVIGSAYLMARWKRAWYAWAAFWCVVALQVVGFIIDLFTGFGRDNVNSPENAAWTMLGLLVLGLLYLLGRLPRRRIAAIVAPVVSHVVHHHVVHGSASEVGWDASGVPVSTGTVPPGVEAAWHADAIPGRVERPAIEAPKMRPASTWREALKQATRGEHR